MALGNCLLQNSILKASTCGYALQSVKDIYLANKNDISAITYSTTTGETCSQEVATVDFKDGAKWARIEPATNSASFTDTFTRLDNGGAYRTHAVSFSIVGNYTPEMVCVVDQLSLGEYIVVAALASGNHVMLGTPEVGLTATAVTNTGAASASDASGLSVEMSADVAQAAVPLSAEAIDALKANLAEAL